MITTTIVMFYLASSGEAVIAQEPLNYWRNPEMMIQDQATLLFQQAHKILSRYPPSTVVNDERKLALFSLDALLHDTRLDNGKAFIDYINNQYLHVAGKLRNEQPKWRETRIYKLYNHGFVMQTPSITIGMDIIRGGSANSPFVHDSVIQAVVDQCDILFISHQHGDHADKSVAQLFCDRKKTVVAPPGVWEGMSPHILYIRDQKTVIGTALTVYPFPGHQDNMINNVYAITTPEGVTVMHTGDQYHIGDMEWISRVGDALKVDILLMHSWMPETEKSIDGIKPGLIIVGHENEMGHTIDHRESYMLSFRIFKEVKTPYIIMAWGEYYTFLQ